MMLDWLSRHGWLFVWLTLVITAYFVRNIFPLDETRYLSVAWEMWLRNDFLIPYLNGEQYTHKPPLLFWLFHIGWSIFGVNEWWPRLVQPLFALSGLYMARVIAHQLWPEKVNAALLTPWILGGSLFWAIYTTAVMFEMLLMAMVLLSMIGVWRAAKGRMLSGWLLVGIAGGLGMLIKGPVMMLHIFFPVILAPWWSSEVRQNKQRWYAGFLLAVLLATIIALCWLLPALYSGGSLYGQEILWRQSVDRAISSFAHQRPFWWYVPLLPFILFPWLVWPPVWRALANLKENKDDGIMFLLSWLLPTFITFSIISGKQVYYLIPLFPALALLIARGLDGWPHEAKRTNQILPALFIAAAGIVLLILPESNFTWMPELPEPLSPVWGIGILVCAMLLLVKNWPRASMAVIPLSLVSAGLVVLLMFAIFTVSVPIQNVAPTAQRILQWQSDGKPVAHLGKYHGQFQFVGRLKKPIVVLSGQQLESWCEMHSDGYVIMYKEKVPATGEPQPVFSQQYRNKWITVWSASSIKNVPDTERLTDPDS